MVSAIQGFKLELAKICPTVQCLPLFIKKKQQFFYEKQNKNNSWSWTITIFVCLLFLSYTKFSTSGWFNQWYMVNIGEKKIVICPELWHNWSHDIGMSIKNTGKPEWGIKLRVGGVANFSSIFLFNFEDMLKICSIKVSLQRN